MRKRNRKRLMAEINVVPYIDVMLVLLIIFMITAPLLTQGVKVDLPKVSSSPLPPNDKEPVIINLDKKGYIYINYGENKEKPISKETLVNRVVALLQHQPNIPVLVGADKNVYYSKVVEVMALLQEAKVSSIGMITEPIYR